MKKIIQICFMLQLGLLIIQSAKAQLKDDYADDKARLLKFNHIKLSIDALALPGITGLTYERKLGKKFSVLLAGYLPFIKISSGTTTLRYSGFGIQPEVRVYLGKNSMRGWYFGLYYIHTDYSIKLNTNQDLTIESNELSSIVPFNATASLPFKHDGVGISMGPQFLIGNRISLGIQLACSIGSSLLTNPIVTNITATGNFDKSQFLGFIPDTQNVSSVDGTLSFNGVATFSAVTNTANINGTAAVKTIDLPNIYPKFGFSLGYVFGR